MTYSFSDLEPVCCSMSSSNCCFLTCIQISQEAGRVVWHSHLSQNCPQFIVNIIQWYIIYKVLHHRRAYQVLNKFITPPLKKKKKYSCYVVTLPLLVSTHLLSVSRVRLFWMACDNGLFYAAVCLWLLSRWRSPSVLSPAPPPRRLLGLDRLPPCVLQHCVNHSPAGGCLECFRRQ